MTTTNPNTLRDLALDQMIHEAASKGGDVTRDQIEAAVAADPSGAAAQRLAEYERLGQATMLAGDALRRQGIDPSTLSGEQILRCAQAVRDVLDREAVAVPAAAPTAPVPQSPAPARDRGPELDF